ncbi:DUF3592 domain-containing protein [Leptospira ognonensis]|uniref:DUF3592 domain-containing protein n=1 Tax=Leptospira ognonensis TaxID=2484945 RepID=A0A4R9K2I7_9LEPT|nr:DUF3592 domain-containing protein [Leptospira ognonensis]TGL59346.1 DUF3592 domain-containing protein [Leptospira ognonensis]
MKTKITSRLLQLFALYLFFTSAYAITGNVIIVRTGAITLGKVVSSYKEFDYTTQTRGKSYGTSHYIQRPIIKYNINGETFEVVGQIKGEVGDEYQIGQEVELYYSIDNPSYSKINSFWEFWYEPIRNLCFSILIFLFGTNLSLILSKVRSRFL